jgi:hypothetical protein
VRLTAGCLWQRTHTAVWGLLARTRVSPTFTTPRTPRTPRPPACHRARRCHPQRKQQQSAACTKASALQRPTSCWRCCCPATHNTQHSSSSPQQHTAARPLKGARQHGTAQAARLHRRSWCARQQQRAAGRLHSSCSSCSRSVSPPLSCQS